MPTFEVVTAVDEDLVLPMKGADGKVREYAIRPATAGQFIRISAMQQTLLTAYKIRARTEADGPDEGKIPTTQHDLHSLLLGDEAVQAMVADGVSAADFRRASQTAFQWHCSGGDADVAARAWAGKAKPSPVTLSARAGDAVPSTRPQASGSGTTTRPRRKASAKA